jgi:hypothetical protein
MDDITNKYEFQRILQEAAQYRLLRRVFDSLPPDERDSSSVEGPGFKDTRFKFSEGETGVHLGMFARHPLADFPGV